MQMKQLPIISKIRPLVNSIGPRIADKAPEVMVVAGVVGVVAAGVWACKVTADKLPEILDEKDELLDLMDNCECPDRDPEEARKDHEKSVKKVNRVCAWKIVKAYAMPVGLAAVSVASILGGNHIIKKRYVAALAGMQGLQTAYDNYRARIVDKFGEAADKYAAYGIETEEIEVEETDENGKVVKTKKEIEIMKDVTGASAHSPYFQLIGPDSALYRESQGNPIFMRNQLEIYESVLNEMYDRGLPIYYNDSLKHIFGNDIEYVGEDGAVHTRLTDDGQIVGWYKYDKKNRAMGDERISLRIGTIHNHNDETDKDEIWFYIDPNVFGPVRLGR